MGSRGSWYWSWVQSRFRKSVSLRLLLDELDELDELELELDDFEAEEEPDFVAEFDELDSAVVL
jgi:hypothetical protein